MRARLGAISLSALVLIGCTRDRPQSLVPDASSSLELQFAGCAAVLEGPACELPPSGVLRIWVPGSTAPSVAFDARGDAGAGATVAAEGGFLITVQVPVGAGVVQLQGSEQQAARRGSLRVGLSTEPAWAQRAQSLRRSGKLDEAEAEIARAPKTGASDEARAEGLLARIALVRGDVQGSIAHFEAAIGKDVEAGLVSHRADDAMALSFALVQRSLSYGRAREVLDALPPMSASYPEGWAREPYYRGLIEGKAGNWRGALTLLRESRARATRLGMAPLKRNSEEAIAGQLLLIGRTREALEIQRKLASSDTDATPACDRAVLANNMAFALLSSSGGTTQQERAEAVSLLGSSLDFLDRGCPDPYRRASVMTDLVIAMLQDGQLERARVQLKKARELWRSPTGTLPAWWQEAEGRLALAKGDAKAALRAFDAEQELARATAQLPLQWSAAVGRGMALESMGRIRDALQAFEDADALLDRAAELVPLGEGRALFVGDRTRGAQRRIALLLDQSRQAEALAVARQSRARVLRSLQLSNRVRSFAPEKAREWEDAVAEYRRQRDALSTESEKDWQLPSDQLAERQASRQIAGEKLRASLERAVSMIVPAQAEPAAFWSPADNPDVLLVAFHPVPDGWAVFAARGGELQSARVRGREHESPEELAARLIEPVRAQLSKARRIRFMPHGRLRSVDFHRLPHEGRPLVEHASVEYAVDLPAVAPVPAGIGPALVVANPTRDLVSAEQEGVRVAEALRTKGGAGVTLLKGSEATVAALNQALPAASFFHYAGHGEAKGAEGWESALPLAGNAALWVSDILALPGGPRNVVLSACEAAKGSLAEEVETLSLGHAFVLAGAQEVVAPTRPVPDRLASEIVTRLYEWVAGSPPLSLAESLSKVQSELARREPSWDWQAFRVLTR